MAPNKAVFVSIENGGGYRFISITRSRVGVSIYPFKTKYARWIECVLGEPDLSSKTFRRSK